MAPRNLKNASTERGGYVLDRGYGNASTAQGGHSKNRNMKKTGMILLALYLIIDGLLGLGVNFGPLVMLLYVIAIVAGVLLLLGALKSSG